MSVRVEFFGIPRARAGCDHVLVDANTVGEAIASVAALRPDFAAACVENAEEKATSAALRKGLIANINGRQFTTDPRAPLKVGDVLMILSADVGG